MLHQQTHVLWLILIFYTYYLLLFAIFFKRIAIIENAQIIICYNFWILQSAINCIISILIFALFFLGSIMSIISIISLLFSVFFSFYTDDFLPSNHLLFLFSDVLAIIFIILFLLYTLICPPINYIYLIFSPINNIYYFILWYYLPVTPCPFITYPGTIPIPKSSSLQLESQLISNTLKHTKKSYNCYNRIITK